MERETYDNEKNLSRAIAFKILQWFCLLTHSILSTLLASKGKNNPFISFWK